MFSRSDAQADALAWKAAQVAHKLCEHQAAQAVWLNKHPYGLPSEAERKLDLRSAIEHAETALKNHDEAYLLKNGKLLKRGADGRYDRTYGV